MPGCNACARQIGRCWDGKLITRDLEDGIVRAILGALCVFRMWVVINLVCYQEGMSLSVWPSPTVKQDSRLYCTHCTKGRKWWNGAQPICWIKRMGRYYCP